MFLRLICIFQKVDSESVKCKGQDIEIKEQHMDEMKECFKVVGVSSRQELNANNGGCFSKCIMTRNGLVSHWNKFVIHFLKFISLII